MKGSDIPLYPVMDSQFRVKKNSNILKMNTTYKIVGWGYGKWLVNKPRRRFWMVEEVDALDGKAQAIPIWKSTLNELYDNNLIIDVYE